MTEAEVLRLWSDDARVDIHPREGASIGRFDVRHQRAWEPVLQTAPDPGRRGAFALGCFLLAPFSNRLSGGGFCHEGRFYEVPPNLSHSPYPTHGDAFSLPWTVGGTTTDSATLLLPIAGPGPFRYAAEVRFRLRDTTLDIALSVRNDGPVALPFGIGLHPWFVRTPKTRLTLSAQGYWSEDAEHFPDIFHPAGTGRFDFRSGAPLPREWLNSAFTGWDGRARLDWPERGLAVEMEATPPLTTAIIYAPSPEKPFVCVEPVSHSVDAHNRADPGTAPPQLMAPGEGLAARVSLRVVRSDPG